MFSPTFLGSPDSQGKSQGLYQRGILPEDPSLSEFKSTFRGEHCSFNFRGLLMVLNSLPALPVVCWGEKESIFRIGKDLPFCRCRCAMLGHVPPPRGGP